MNSAYGTTTNVRTTTHLRRLDVADGLRAAAPLSAGYSDSVVFCTSLVGRELRRFPEALQLTRGRFDLQPESGQQVPQPTVEQYLREASSPMTAPRFTSGCGSRPQGTTSTAAARSVSPTTKGIPRGFVAAT